MRKFMEQICSEYAANKNFSGVCVLKMGDEVLFEKAFGYANRAFQVPNQIDTRFDTASITKLFTAVAVLQLVEQGKLSLEDKITKIVDLRGTQIPGDVTIHHLLSHTSGIADDADEEAGEDYADLFIDSPNYAIRECCDFLKNFAYKDPMFQAGTNARYCNCAFVLLGLAIEKVTGANFREYYVNHVFAKAGMKNTGFLSMDGINPNTAEGYTSIEDEEGNFLGYKKNIYCYPPIGTPDGGAYTTADDLDKFLMSIRNNVLLSGKYSEMLLKPQAEYKTQKDWFEVPGLYQQYGYAFEYLIQTGKEKPFCIYKDGANNGVANRFSYYPEKDIRLILLANQDCDVWMMTKEIQLEIYKRFYA